MAERKHQGREPKRVGVWVRVSTEDQAKGDSPEHHEKRARFYAEARGWDVATVYHLEGVSGKSVLDHPEARRMLADIRSGGVSGVIFSKIARLARNTRELLDFADEFEKNGADLISLSEAIDTSSPAGRLFFTILAAMAQWEREEIAERVAASVPIRAKLGKSLGGAPPYGYRRVDGKLALDEREAPVRRRLFELFIEHKRKKTVARMLNEAGHRTRSGSKFTGKSLERLISDPIAKGSRRMNYRESPGRGGKEKPPAEWIYVEAPPIVAEDVWDAANEILRGQHNPRGQPAKKASHLFSGIVYCAKCDERMYVRTRMTSYVCEGCRNKVDAKDLETVFVEQLKGMVSSPERIAERLERANADIGQEQELLRALEAELSSATTEADKLYRLYVDGNLSGSAFAERNRPLEERIRQLRDEIPARTGSLDVKRLQILSSDEIVSEAKDLYARWPSLEFEERREIVEGITERILISDNEITIRLAYLPFECARAPRENGTNGARTVTDWRRRPAEIARDTRPPARLARSPRARPPSAGAWRRARGAAARGVRRGTGLRDGRG
jgi:site-specific DNA recombinase